MTRTTLTTKAPYRSDRGEVIGNSRDISHRKPAELERARELRLLRTLIDALSDIAYAVDTDGRFLLCNWMDGYALAAAIREKSHARRCLDVGMDECLVKPVQLATLRTMLSKHFLDPTVDVAPGGRPSDDSAAPAVAAADLDVLIALIGDESAVINEVLRAFRISAARASADLNHGSQTESLKIASDAAHKLKSGARTIGAIRLADCCAAIEASAQAGKPDGLLELLPRFEGELSTVYRFLDSSTGVGT